MKPLPIWRRLLARPGALSVPLLPLEGRVTFKRFWNARQAEREYRRGATVLRSRPVKLVIEATNVCNLSCPGCLTGMGENGRVRSAIDQGLFRRVLDELAGALLQIEFYNWGEPLLCKSIYAMIGEAERRGVGTLVSTNFSIPFTEADAEALVKSNLAILGVSMDGCTQETYARYRIGGDIERVKRNVRMVADAKQRLGSARPHIVWSYHVFGHNRHEVDQLQGLAPGLGFNSVALDKGFNRGEDWEADGEGFNIASPPSSPCHFLWHYAVVHNDGGVAACCGSFYREDDMGNLTISPSALTSGRFEEVWNNAAFQQARGLFAKGKSAPAAADKPEYLCTTCPRTRNWWALQSHLAAGGARETFRSPISGHAGYNYFLERRPAGRDTKLVLRPVRAKSPRERV